MNLQANPNLKTCAENVLADPAMHYLGQLPKDKPQILGFVYCADKNLTEVSAESQGLLSFAAEPS